MSVGRLTALSGTRAGPTRSPRSTAGPIQSPGRSSTSPCRYRAAWWGYCVSQESSLEGFVDAVLAPIAVGNTVVAVASELRPTPAVLVGEMSATSDFPAGVLNIITGVTDELAPTLASHEDVDGIDLSGVDVEQASELNVSAAGSIKRVYRPKVNVTDPTRRLRAFIETSTVWHTIGQ